MLKTYFKRIFDIARRGDATEQSYYSSLEELLKSYATSIGKKHIDITTIPKKTDAGNPDFRVWDGKQQIIGYIEAKAPDIEYLDHIETTDQLKRYLHIFPNLLLTNFFEFRLYRNGVLIDKVLTGRPYVIHKLKTVPPVEKETEFLKLLEKFFSFSLPKVYDARNLAIELAKRTSFLKDEVIAQELKEEEKKGKGNILNFYKVFKDHLISGLTKEDFADLYSQTITYGLFAARTRTENGFNRKLAYDRIPKTIGILRDVFKFISLGDLPQQMEWIVDDISEVLATADVYKILNEYFNKHKGKDPIVHFYETFLSEYDPKTREKRGVYYTPEPVVSYIVRSLHHILKEHFDKKDGLASPEVTVLDPAAGTLTFLAEAAHLAVQEFTLKYGEGKRKDFIKEHILKNFYAFELMIAPYAIGHLKMSFLLEELGYKLQADDRFKLYLTNTLEMEDLAQTELPGMASLSEESHLAGKVKKEKPILVILGNPPYSGHSSNIGDWISKEIKTYFQVDGKPLGEKNPKWLQDDYVKFIRFAQWKIDQAGEGVLGFITNHSYLDNPTFRGMRQSLMQSFDEIYLLDLHGNSLKKERCPDGSKDENVFDIQQGVAIGIFVKKRRGIGHKIYRFDLWGLREEKYNWLVKNDIKTTKWKKLLPRPEFYLFAPRNEKLALTYYEFIKLDDIFNEYSLSIQTHRDHFVIDIDKEALKRRIRMFRDKKMPDELIRQSFHLTDTSDWKLNCARERVMEDDEWEQKIIPIIYRPFDRRWIFYSEHVVDRPRKEIMQNMECDNLALLVSKQQAVKGFHHALITTQISESCVVSNKTKEGNYHFPLYLCKPKPKHKSKVSSTHLMMLFEPESEYYDSKPNLSGILADIFYKAYRRTPEPEEVFYYIYAVLYSNIYRTKYAEFLKIDFPRIPFTKDYRLFKKMIEYGERLVELHLLKSSEIDTPIVRFHGEGNDKVEKVNYEGNKPYINNAQYFEGVSKKVYEYQIGGYQVCAKWLKDRKGRTLSLEEIKHYCKIVTALKKTIDIQQKIDAIYSDIEKEIV
jgi:type I restriction-modification system DNA methylase subunit